MASSIAVDAMGGDYGPEVTVPGTLSALTANPDTKFILVGDGDLVHEHLQRANQRESQRLRVIHTSEVVGMNESPAHAVRRKKDSSMRVAIDLVKSGEVAACVSAGNTGALMAIAHLMLRTFPGIHRPAIIGQIPTVNGHVNLLDLGANVECSSADLLQFGIMGSTFVKYMEDKPDPKVALLNIGVEDIKGNQTIKDASKLFQASTLNYQGYIEGDAIFSGEADVIVCDGFAGNIVIKTGAGVSKFIQNALRKELQKNFFRRLAALTVMPALKGVKSRIDPRVFNGAAMIGLQGTVIKSHGSADALAFSYALRQAVIDVRNEIPSKINQEVSAVAEAVS